MPNVDGVPKLEFPHLSLAYLHGSREFSQRELAPRAADIDTANSFPKDVNLWTLMGEFGLHGELFPGSDVNECSSWPTR
jgi:Acyl-CoA dehydrogenase, N-terminal domain